MAASLLLPTAPVTKRAAAMPTNDSQKRAGQLGRGRLVRYLVRLGYVAAAALALVFLVMWTSPVAEPLAAADTDGAVQAFLATPYVSSDPSLPSAASVFQDQPSEAAQQVDSF